MKKTTTILIILLLATVVGGGFAFSYFLQQRLHSNASPNVSPLDAARVEDLIKKSAQQIEDPSLATVPEDQQDNHQQPAQNTFPCSQSTNFNCYDKYYRGIVKDKSVAAAFADLRIRYNTIPYITSMCHPLAHVIGQAAVDKYPDVSEAYSHGDSLCWSGYYHGVMEGIAFKLGKEKLYSSLNDICADVPGKEKYSFDYYNCVHGLGHGLMAISDNELFDSLKHCDTISGSWEQQSCYGGAFMENVIVDNKEHFTKYLKPDNLLYPCSAADDKYKASCYLMQTSYMLKITHGDFTRVFDICSKAEGSFSAICYQSLGRDASGRSTSNAKITKATCDLGKDYEQKSNCLIGAVKDFISYYHSDKQAKELCMLFDTELQSVCLSTATSYYQIF